MSLFNKLIITVMPLIPKPIVWMVSKRYVAGSRLEDSVSTVKTLNDKGMVATMDVLGESSHKKEECEEAVQEYFDVLERIDKEKLNCNISVKPTQLGMLIDTDYCYENLKKIIDKAKHYNNFVRIDMEDAGVTGKTIDIFLRLQKEYDNTGIVLQAYLRRSLDDVKQLVKTRTNFRLCKGIYVEPRKIAYKDPQTVNDNFALLIEEALGAGSYVGIATHDERVTWHGLKTIHKLNLEKNQYEFQMLLGVDEELRDILVKEGHRMRIYVPYGKQWHAYCMRRLKENPRIALYVTKALFGIK